MSDPRDEDDGARLRTPPHSREAEQSVLGGLIIDNGAWDRVGDLLTEAAFYVHGHRAVFAAIASLMGANKAADPITIQAVLQRTPGHDIDLAYLNALAQSVPSASNIRRYAEIVAERFLERRLCAAGDEIAQLGFGGSGTPAQRVDQAATMILRLEADLARKTTVRPLSELVVELIDSINDLHQQGDDNTGGAWPTFLPVLNRLLAGGLRPGRVYVIAARPSLGKSALGQELAVHMALQHGLSVLFLSQEMPAQELAQRIVAARGGVDLTHIQTARLNDHEWAGLSSGVEVAGRLEFYIDETPALTIGQIRAKARSIRGLKVLVVDYLQLTASMPLARGQTNRNQEIEEVSRGLKSLAKELGIAVILLSQLNREVEKRPGRKPIISDMRDSGAIEADADVVMLMWPLRPDGQVDSDGALAVGIQLAKNRGGPRYIEFPLLFTPKFMRFGESELPMTAYGAAVAAGPKEY